MIFCLKASKTSSVQKFKGHLRAQKILIPETLLMSKVFRSEEKCLLSFNVIEDRASRNSRYCRSKYDKRQHEFLNEQGVTCPTKCQRWIGANA